MRHPPTGIQPASLACRAKTLETSIQSLSLGRRQGSAAIAFNVRGDVGFGFAWSHATVGGIKGRTANGQYTGPIEDRANAFILGIGRSLGPRLAVGLAVKVLKQGIDLPSVPKATANGSGFDLGVQFRAAEHTWLGASISNLKADLSWKVPRADQQSNTTENALPRMLVFGASQQFLDALLLAAEFRADGEQSVNLGAEWQLNALLAIRSGLHRLGTEDGGQLSAGLTLQADAPRDLAIPIRVLNRSPRRWGAHDRGLGAGILRSDGSPIARTFDAASGP